MRLALLGSQGGGRKKLWRYNSIVHLEEGLLLHSGGATRRGCFPSVLQHEATTLGQISNHVGGREGCLRQF